MCDDDDADSSDKHFQETVYKGSKGKKWSFSSERELAFVRQQLKRKSEMGASSRSEIQCPNLVLLFISAIQQPKQN